uniref:Expansin-like EG45 domain-containing protein n=1 Tax=Hyaloperonospora arabidopsidis (strain Emoy2) TaxID=559515 RepID=M4BM08_HYAAE
MMSVLNLAVTDYAALNSEQWDGLQNCGRCAEVSCSDDRCPDKSKTILVQLLDHCPECKHGALDLSPSVFTALTGTTPSRYKVAWKFVDCPVSGNINYCLKGGSNTYWTAVQPTNVATGVKSLQINGHDTVMLDSAYYYVLDGVSETQTQLTDMTITLTDINGNTVTDIVTLTADSCTEGTHQFPPSPQMATGQTTVPIIDLKLPTIELPTTPYVQVPVISPIPPAATSTPINPMPPSVPPTTPDTTSPEQEEVYPAGPTFADETTGDNSPALPDTTYNATGELTDATPKIDLPHLPAPPSTATPPVITATDMPSPEQEEITPPGPTFVHETTSGNSPALPDTTYNATGDLPHPPAPPPTATPPVITATDMPSPEQEEITPPGPTFVHETTSGNSPALPDTTYNATGDLPHPPAPPPMATPPVITATDMPSPKQEVINPPCPTFVHETTAPHPPVQPVTTDGFLATASSAVASTVAAPPITSPITTPVEASLPPNELKLRTGLELGFATSDRNAIKPTQPLTIVAGLGRAPAPEKRPVTKSMDGTRTIVADRRRGQQPRQQKSGLPLATPASTPTIAERTAEGQALGKSDATQEVNTKSWKASDGTDPLIIILSTLGAVAVLALIATVVVAKRKKVEEQKAHEVEVPSMISAQSFDVQNSPTHGGHAFVAH